MGTMTIDFGNTAQFSSNDAIFASFRLEMKNIDNQIAQINKSPVMLALLHAFIDGGGKLIYNNESTNNTDGSTIIRIHDLKENPYDFGSAPGQPSPR